MAKTTTKPAGATKAKKAATKAPKAPAKASVKVRTASSKPPQKAAKPSKAGLTLGPVLFNWSPEVWRDYYFRVADEAPVDTVYVGEVVCSKREPFFEPHRQAVIERLQRAGKTVVLSSLALMTTEREIQSLQEAAASGLLVEANDVAALSVLAGRPFVVGPFINVLNEGARDFMTRQGAVRIVVPVEITQSAVALLAQGAKTPPIEMQVFGRQPLAVSMRCYHSRAQGRDKDHCRLACAADADGLSIETMDGQPILAVNGTSVLSQGYVLLLDEMLALQKQGVSYFRLMPHTQDMVQIATLFRAVLDGKESPDSAQEKLRLIVPNVPFINGFMHTAAGMRWVDRAS